jgi:hypothetical protein
VNKLLLIIVLLPATLMSQNGALEIQSEDSYPFTLFVDGLAENSSPTAKVMVNRLPIGAHFIKIVFAKSGMQSPQERIEIRPNKKHLYKLTFAESKRGVSVALIPQSAEEYILPPPDTLNPPQKSIETSSDKAQSLFESGFQTEKPLPSSDTAIPGKTTSQDAPDTVSVVKIGCGRLIPPKAFELISETIFSEKLEDERLQKAKTLATENCLTAIQIMELVQRFEFENSRLELAKFAFPYCFDTDNYHFVEDALEYDLSRKKLNDYIQKQKKKED